MLSPEQVRIALEYLKIPENEWDGDPHIDIPCPHAELHTKQDNRLCRLFFDRDYPHLYCFHAHCNETLRDLNTGLRLAVLGTTDFPEREDTIPGDYELARRVQRNVIRIIKRFYPKTWPPVSIPLKPLDFLEALGVFKRNDVIWIGKIESSGYPAMRSHFRTLKEWKSNPPPPTWPFTTGAAFLPGTFSRSDANVKVVRSLILESDDWAARETFAIARWIEKELGAVLLAAVFSGRESLHCYFKYPGQKWIDRFKPALRKLGFDHQTFKKSQPIRLAGQTNAKTNATQNLLWLRK
jgi:hypothetical protein